MARCLGAPLPTAYLHCRPRVCAGAKPQGLPDLRVRGTRLPAGPLPAPPQLRVSCPKTRICAAAQEYVEVDEGFSAAKISFGTVLAPLGIGLLVYGFGGYFNLLPGGEVSSLLLIYGFPLMLLGLALKYAELKPAPCKTTAEALKLRDTQMTDIQKQVREDVTRYRYGDEVHLGESLERIFRLGQPSGVARNLCPKLTGIREEVLDGQYALILEFNSPLPEEEWMQRQPKFQSFFGPGIVATVSMREGGADVALVCDGSGAGRGGGEKKDLLPPLLPGLAPREQK